MSTTRLEHNERPLPAGAPPSPLASDGLNRRTTILEKLRGAIEFQVPVG